MIGIKGAMLAAVLAVLSSPGAAETPDRQIGGDILRSGDSAAQLQADRDVLATGFTVTLDGMIAQDGHAAGFAVGVDATTGGDLYGAGFSVGLRGTVGGDLTATGFSVVTGPGAEVAGNARLAGARITINGPIRGALAAVGGKITLNSEVAGDVLLGAETLTFGPDARIGGKLTYSTPERIDIPDFVLSADQIVYEPFQRSEIFNNAYEMWEGWEMPRGPTFLTVFGGFLVTLGFFVVIGALFLTLAPVQVRRLRRSIDARPGMALLTGVIGLSMLFGLVPVSAMTILGIPLVPIVLLAILLVWILGYILGAYALAMRVLRAFGTAENPVIWMRLLALVIGVSFIALLNYIPVLGWMANFALVLLGIGGITTALFERMVGNIDPALDVDMQPIQRNPEQE